MSQSDYTIADQDGASFLVDINAQLAAIVSNNSGSTEPATTYAYEWWADTSSGVLKIRNAANNAWVTVGTLASANLGLLPLTGGTLTGNLGFDGTGLRITGDFSNATIQNRVLFQTSSVNNNTLLGVIPNGTAAQSNIVLYNNSDPTNSSSLNLLVDSSSSSIRAGITGTGTTLPMTFFTNATERLRIDTSGNVLLTNAAGLGYGTGAGGTVTQATSKATSVTLNKPTGKITMNNAALAAGAQVQFTFSNSLIATDDLVIVQQDGSFAASYNIWAVNSAIGNCVIVIKNISAGSLSEAIDIQFSIIKGSVS